MGGGLEKESLFQEMLHNTETMIMDNPHSGA
ncbi:hypothetical protein HOV93_18150 [Planctomycetes bacterium FF15]|uniref:Uncharacterized protein n=1 Tax=Bremerella alba TaxID=980252 RepID=A0A7V8V494_9BACT|nr:hypothetical protein [Bremerella alba]